MIRLRITLKRIFANLSISIIFLIITVVLSVFLYNIDLDLVGVYIPVGFFLILNIPVIVIYINYWIEDKDKIVHIDSNSRTINVTKGFKDLNYRFDDIKRVILVSHSSYKFGQPSRKAPWTDYFYYLIDFKNGERLILTSLLLEQKDFTLTVHHRRFLFIQTIDKFDYDSYIDTEIKVSKQINQEEIDKFKNVYKDYSKSELQDIIDNRKRYESAAVKAARELLEKQNTFANTGS